MASFRELFSFGSKILLSGLIDTVYRNIYLVVIGKFFSATDLGYFTRAQAFKDLPAQQITNVVSRVTYPVLSQIRENPVQLKGAFKRMLTSTTYLSFIVLAGVAAVAEPMIITFIGEAWRPAIIYLQMLCFTGMLLPLQSLNLNMLHVHGRSDLFLRFEIIKKILAVPVIVFGILYGIKILIAGMMVISVINYYIDSYYSGKLADYPMREQVKDVLPAFLLSMFMAAVVFIAGQLMPFSYPVKLILQVILGAVIVYGVSEILHLSSYLYFKENIASRISAIRRMNK
jgi:O-antigen/teichoic acid export membrane protein